MLVFITALLFSCNKDEPPKPEEDLLPSSFTYEIDRHTEVVFEGNTQGNAYHWDFGDGLSSTKRNPRHVFPITGEYEVTFTVETDTGDMVSTQKVAVEIPLKFVISRKWEIVSGTKNEADYTEANGSQYQFWGDGKMLAGSLEFSWYFENDQESIIIDYGPGFDNGLWHIDKLTVYEMHVHFDSKDHRYTYQFKALEE